LVLGRQCKSQTVSEAAAFLKLIIASSCVKIFY
jgi:hypothetical protein